ncbi:MAG: FoF1 ATP synthase subunit gamma [bacterium]|nr:FoF1 ATP synthase subunit gamma [bacterium]
MSIKKDQIYGFQDVSETVKTVEKIAASFVHTLKQEVSNLHAYKFEIENVLSQLLVYYKKREHPLLQKNSTGTKALVILTGNKGLVGGLWHSIINKYLEKNKEYQSIVTIGTKGKKFLEEERIGVINDFTYFSDIPSEEEIINMTNYFFEKYKKGSFSQVDILFPQFVSFAEQTPQIIPFLPFVFTLNEDMSNKEGLPIFEPSKQKVFHMLLQKYIGVYFYSIIIEAKLSEFSARTIAMEHAAVKTSELVEQLLLDYEKEKRRTVTQNQLESFVAHKIKYRSN